MRLKEDHMKNGQLKPAYNVQIAVESEYIIGLGLFPNPTDTTTLIPFLQRMEAMQHRKIGNIVADAGYSSEENFTYLKENGQTAYIKPQDYEQKKTKKYRQQIFRAENLIYRKNKDCFICPWGKKLVNTMCFRNRLCYRAFQVFQKCDVKFIISSTKQILSVHSFLNFKSA